MKVLQILPALDSGGVERGTVDFARLLTQRGHESWVMSAGGRLAAQLEQEGSRHICYPVHQKHLKSLLRVRGLRRHIQALKPDVIHVRSRIPAWMTWLALRKLPPSQRPALVSTFHGLYSVSPYSAIMGCGDQVIAISECVKNYIRENYPKIPAEKIHIIHRGVDTSQFNPDHTPEKAWQQALYQQYPLLEGKPLVLMPGRLSRWKGQPEFIELIAGLVQKGIDCHGVIVGAPTPGKDAYLEDLRQMVESRALGEHITFLGHCDNMPSLYALSAVVCNLSQHPEPFGRTVIEALAMGVPVVSYNYGGPAESLRDCLPQGLVPLNDPSALEDTVISMLQQRPDIELPGAFTLEQQAESTLAVYHTAIELTAPRKPSL